MHTTIIWADVCPRPTGIDAQSSHTDSVVANTVKLLVSFELMTLLGYSFDIMLRPK